MKYLGRNTLSMLAVAAFTMVATLAVLSPVGADAEDGEDAKTAENLAKITPVISVPKLEQDNCTISLKADKESYDVGDKPVLTVVVTNDGAEAIEKKITVSMTSKSMFEGGRMPSVARVVWTETKTVTLAAGESQTLTLTPDKGVQEFQTTSFSMSEGKEEVTADAKLRRAVEKIVERKNAN